MKLISKTSSCIRSIVNRCSEVFRDVYTGFVRALEILENPGKFLRSWTSLETPGKTLDFFLLSPGKSHRTLLKNKFAKWCILLISLQVTIEIVDFCVISRLHFVLGTTA